MESNNHHKSNGRWTSAQHELFLLGLHLHGKNWKKIESMIPTRNGSQIRSHAQKFFLKNQQPERNEVTAEGEDSKEGEKGEASEFCSPQEFKQMHDNDTGISFFRQHFNKLSQDIERRPGAEVDFWKQWVQLPAQDARPDRENKENQQKCKKRAKSFVPCLADEEQMERIAKLRKMS